MATKNPAQSSSSGLGVAAQDYTNPKAAPEAEHDSPVGPAPIPADHSKLDGAAKLREFFKQTPQLTSEHVLFGIAGVVITVKDLKEAAGIKE